MARAVENSSLDDDALAGDTGTGDIAAEIVLEDFEACLLRNQADMDVRARRLRRRFRQIGKR